MSCPCFLSSSDAQKEDDRCAVDATAGFYDISSTAHAYAQTDLMIPMHYDIIPIWPQQFWVEPHSRITHPAPPSFLSWHGQAASLPAELGHSASGDETRRGQGEHLRAAARAGDGPASSGQLADARLAGPPPPLADFISVALSFSPAQVSGATLSLGFGSLEGALAESVTSPGAQSNASALSSAPTPSTAEDGSDPIQISGASDSASARSECEANYIDRRAATLEGLPSPDHERRPSAGPLRPPQERRACLVQAAERRAHSREGREHPAPWLRHLLHSQGCHAGLCRGPLRLRVRRPDEGSLRTAGPGTHAGARQSSPEAERRGIRASSEGAVCRLFGPLCSSTLEIFRRGRPRNDAEIVDIGDDGESASRRVVSRFVAPCSENRCSDESRARPLARWPSFASASASASGAPIGVSDCQLLRIELSPARRFRHSEPPADSPRPDDPVV